MGLLTADAFTIPAVPDLKVADRCDRCSAQALVRVQMPSKKLLDFCQHDYRKHELALITQGANVVRIIHQEGK